MLTEIERKTYIQSKSSQSNKIKPSEEMEVLLDWKKSYHDLWPNRRSKGNYRLFLETDRTQPNDGSLYIICLRFWCQRVKNRMMIPLIPF